MFSPRPGEPLSEQSSGYTVPSVLVPPSTAIQHNLHANLSGEEIKSRSKPGVSRRAIRSRRRNLRDTHTPNCVLTGAPKPIWNS